MNKANIIFLAMEAANRCGMMRKEVLETMDEEDESQKESVRALFVIADKLTALLEECLNIDHELGSETSALIFSVISGISTGEGIEAVQKMISATAQSHVIH